MVSLINYEPRYQDQVLSLILTIQQDEYQIPITLSDQPDLLNIPNIYQTNKGNFWLAIENGEVVGTIALIDINESFAIIRKMFVKQNFRGKEKNIATQLLQTLLDWAKTNSFTAIYLGTTTSFKAAHRFYEKNGFIEIDKSQLPASFPLVAVDNVFYQYTIKRIAPPKS